MKRWLRRVRGVLGMGLVWAVAWAIVGGGLMEGIVDPHGKILDMWPQTLAIPGFLGGVVFSMVLWIAERRRRFGELSLSRFAAWGAVAGLLVGLLPFAVWGLNPAAPVWLPAVVIGSITGLSAASASCSLALARRAEKRELPDAGANVSEVGRTEGESQPLLGGRG